MFCKNCGVQLREGARFCSNCGTSVEKYNLSDVPEKRPVNNSDEAQAAAQEMIEYVLGKNLVPSHELYQGWTLTNSLFDITPVEINMPGSMIAAMLDGKIEFVCLTPPAITTGSNFMQASMCEDGTIHFEVSMAKDDGVYRILAKDNVGAAHACNYMTAFMSKGILPYDLDTWYKI